MQNDGNLVLYGPNQKPLWASNTAGNPGSRLFVQPDGNVVIYAPNNLPIWDRGTMNPGQQLMPNQSITSLNGQFTLIYQGDGNLVLYQNNPKHALWASWTMSTTPVECIMQSDGNLVLYGRGLSS